MQILRVLFGIALACEISICQAVIITLDPVDSGEIIYLRQHFLYPPFPTTEDYRHDAPLTELSWQQYSSAGCLCSVLYLVNGYVTYDVSSLGFSVGSATLELDFRLDSFGELGFLAINSIDEFTPEELSALPPPGLGLPLSLGDALTQDIASGVLLGSLELTAGTGIYSVELNNAAVDLINGTNGLLAFGVYYVADTANFNEGITQISFNGAPRLQLDDTPQNMPEPGTASLLLAALLLVSTRKGNPANTLKIGAGFRGESH